MSLLDTLLSHPTVLRTKLPNPLPPGLQSSVRKLNTNVEKVRGAIETVKRAIDGRPDIPSQKLVEPGATWKMVAEREDPQFNFNWDVFLLVNGLSFDLGPYIEEVQLPSVSIQSQEVFREGQMIPHGEHENVGDVSLRVYEDVNQSAMRFFRRWKMMIRTPEGHYATTAEYMGTLILYTKDQTGKRIASYICSDVWPTTIGGYTWASGQGERQILDVTLSVAKFAIRDIGEKPDPVNF